MSKVHSEHEGISVARLPTKSENLQTQRILCKIENILQKLMTSSNKIQINISQNTDLVKPGHNVPSPLRTVLQEKLMIIVIWSSDKDVPVVIYCTLKVNIKMDGVYGGGGGEDNGFHWSNENIKVKSS